SDLERAVLAAPARVCSLLLAGSAAVFAGACKHTAGDAGAPAPQVSVAPVLEEQVRQWDEFTGRVVAKESVELRPRVSGYIQKINFVEGKEVQRGDVLFLIDARSYQAELDRAKAELLRTRTQAQLAHTESVRADKLAAARAISTEELDQRHAAEAQAGAGVRAA